MLAAYVVAAIVAGGLIVFSAIAGMEGHASIGDVGSHDAPGHTHGEGADSAGSVWLQFLTLRFWTYAIGAFGLIGLVLTLRKASVEPLTMTIAGGTGLVVGTISAWFYRFLSKSEHSSSIGGNDFLGAIGKVTVAIGAEPGKVRTSIKGEIIDMVAVGHTGEPFVAGEEVIIVGLDGNNAQVARKGDFLGE